MALWYWLVIWLSGIGYGMFEIVYEWSNLNQFGGTLCAPLSRHLPLVWVHQFLFSFFFHTKIKFTFKCISFNWNIFTLCKQLRHSLKYSSFLRHETYSFFHFATRLFISEHWQEPRCLILKSLSAMWNSKQFMFYIYLITF